VTAGPTSSREDRPRPVVLVVLDGFGIGANPADDAIASTPMPNWRAMLDRWPHARLRASEDAVGLPPGQMGNSEVGHLNLGAGRPVLQDLPRIDAAIADGSFAERPALLDACRRAATRSGGGGRLHVISLVGPGGVHAKGEKDDQGQARSPRGAERNSHWYAPENMSGTWNVARSVY